MTASSRLEPLKPQENYEIEDLQHAIQENTRKLKEVQQKRLDVEEEITTSRSEIELRAGLMMEQGEIVDALHQLGRLLQKEKHLTEQMNDQAAADRTQMGILEERYKSAADKARSIAAKIKEVKQQLAEIKAHKSAAQASGSVPASKSKRRQRK